MADISKIKLADTEVNIKDATARNWASQMATQTQNGRMSMDDKKKLDSLKVPIIIYLTDGTEDFTAFNSPNNREQIKSAIMTSNPNVYVLWEDKNGIFLSPVSINVHANTTFVTVWGNPYRNERESGTTRLIGVEYFCNGIPSSTNAFIRAQSITCTRGNTINLT